MTKTLPPLTGAALVATILFTAAPSYPWGDKGHEIIGHVAEAYLTDQAREYIKAIVGETISLAKEGVWPDQVGRKIGDMDPFHFVNFPTDATTYERDRDCPDRNCVVEAIPWYQRVLVEKDAPLNVRRIALRYVVHLVGDIHQPLHAAHGKDRGGNTISTKYKGKQMSLHALWDSTLLEAEEGTSAEIATRLQQSISPQHRHQWQAGTPAQWALAHIFDLKGERTRR